MDNFNFEFRISITKLRGAYLDMAADLEFLLVDIIAVCLLRHDKERNHLKEILIAHSMLSFKIKSAQKALRVYNSEYAERYTEHFKLFNELKEARNKFSHSRIEGDKEQNDLDILHFMSFQDGELIEKTESRQTLVNKLKLYAEAIHNFTSQIIPVLYYERHVKRYHNILQHPSNRSMSYWHNYFEGIKKEPSQM